MNDYKDKSRFEIYEPVVVTHRGKTIRSVTSSRKFNEFYKTLGQQDYKIAILSFSMEGRPDIISQAAYGTPAYWWLIVLANNASDYARDFVTGDEVKIPIL